MAHDIVSQFYASLTLPLRERLIELTRIIDTSSPSKDLQTIFPQLINNIFSTSFTSGWGLQTITHDVNRLDYEILVLFLEPQGPMFRLCYKLLSDPQLKYNLPLNCLPMELQMSLERGRCPQFYADMLAISPHTMNVAALALNPFDYYIFNFALHLVNSTQNKTSWEHWNSVYFALACDYLTHFLPSDPNIPVLPHIPNYTGKVPIAAPLQTANRPCSPSLLLRLDVSMSNQHAAASQTQSRNEVWRSETVLQVLVDVWMSVDSFDTRTDLFQRNYPIMVSSPERVRTVRVLVKHIHSFSAKHLSDPAIRSSSLRKYARQIMCSRAYQYIKYLVTTWPLDASFRLVMELWLSLIQPWRYANNDINRDRIPNTQQNQDDGNVGSFDPSYIQFIAENYPSYTCILQLVLPRFMRLDLTAYKNAVMLFRLGKVYSQPHLVSILRDLEQAITESSSGYSSPDVSFNNNSGFGFSYSGSGLPLKKWAAIAKQAISEMNMSNTFEYGPLWSEDKKQFGMEFVKKILSAKYIAEKNIQESEAPAQQNQGFWASVANWLMITDNETDHALEESKKVPNYLNNCSHYFVTIFGINEDTLPPAVSILEDTSAEHSSFSNVTNFPLTITTKLRNRTTDIHYMGDPDLMPITSYESTILVRMLYQIATKINEMYQDQFTRLWNRTDFCGFIAREVLQKPCTIHSYVKDCTNHQSLVRKELPARLSLRRLGSHACVTWVIIGYTLFRMFSYAGMTYLFFLIVLWTSYVIMKASMKFFNIVRV